MKGPIAWCITGAGHWLSQSLDVALARDDIDFYLSRAAEEVLAYYRFEERLTGRPLFRDRQASSPQSGRLTKGVYGGLVVAPATSNSVAKFVLGLSDSLVTTLFAQAGKSGLPILVLPTDTEPVMESIDPAGQAVAVHPRPLDLANVERLGALPGVTVVTSPEALALRLEGR